MSSYAQKRNEFIAVLTRELPNERPREVAIFARKLMGLARTHCRYQVMQCGDGSPNQEANCRYAEEREAALERRIEKLCTKYGVKAVFSGDPRGCTVKVAVPSGNTDDIGREGLCVPQPYNP